MNSNKKLDELFDQLKQVDRSDKARQDSLIKLQTQIHKKKRIHWLPTFISGAMLAIIAMLFLAYNTEGSPPVEGQSAEFQDANEHTIQYVLEQEFTGPDEEFILSEKNSANALLDSDGSPELPGTQAIDQDEFLKNTYKTYFTVNGFERFMPYAFFYHLGGVPSAYEMSLGQVDIVQNEQDPAQYDISFVVHFTNSSGTDLDFLMSAKASFAEAGILEDITFEDDEGLSIAILENI